MFSLIITIISIALVAALALATIYYGGNAFTEGGDAARAAQIVNEGQQLQGANTLRKVQVEGSTNVAAVADLVSNYLAQAPAGWDVAAGVGFTRTAENDKVCAEVNKKAGNDAGYLDAAGIPAGQVFGCATDTLEVTYKF